MQAISVTIINEPYDGCMKSGRPSKRKRTEFGKRILSARETLGLSQAQIAEKLGMSQKGYAVWERYPVALKPEQVQKLTKVLQVTPDYLFANDASRSRKGGPVGKARRLFEQVSRLPRSQQLHVLTVVEAFVENKTAGVEA
jgi:transcriptional regulator with XRE-family HTH domain